MFPLLSRRTSLILIGILAFSVTAITLGLILRRQLGIEVSVEGVRAWVETLGWKGPTLFVLLVTFRQFLLLPSAIVLAAGGICFGAAAGTVLGGTGLLLSALMKFFIARGFGREWVRARLQGRWLALDGHAERVGAVAVGIATACPMGPMAPLHWAAGLSSVRMPAFVLAVVLASPVRAFAYSLFGTTLEDVGSPAFVAAIAFIVTIALLPLAFPAVRRRIRAGLKAQV
jgi:uncharacterized membrane protein YdjX (TVP38/TMEM64 family)